MKKITFAKVLTVWFFLAVILNLLNGYFVKSSLLYSSIMALLGVFLLIYPVYPNALKNRYDEKRCKVIVRGIALAQIVLSFCVHTNF